MSHKFVVSVNFIDPFIDMDPKNDLVAFLLFWINNFD